LDESTFKNKQAEVDPAKIELILKQNLQEFESNPAFTLGQSQILANESDSCPELSPSPRAKAISQNFHESIIEKNKPVLRYVDDLSSSNSEAHQTLIEVLAI
jgi:hypothetical protein